ncbi:MAG: glutamate ABC transporter substrate-binding protein, partial [Actinomycetales bacterium]
MTAGTRTTRPAGGRGVRSRRLATVAAAAVAALTLAGCSSSGSTDARDSANPGVPGASSSAAGGASGGASGGAATSTGNGSGDMAAIQQILDKAPVADAAKIPDGSLMAEIKKRGVLNVGGTDTAPLFSLKNPITGELTGFDADLSKMLAKYIIGKPETKLTQVSVDTREALLQNGSVDTVFATYTITAPRAQKVDFAGPYYSSGDAILVKKGSSIKTVDDLNGKTVATEANSTAANAIKKFAPNSKVILFQQNNECVQAVEQGRADAYVLDQGILIGDAAKNQDVTVVGQPFTQEPYGIGTPK